MRPLLLTAVIVSGLWLPGPSALANPAEPGRLVVSPLLVAPREHPKSQLVTVRFDGENAPQEFDATVALAGGEAKPVEWFAGEYLPAGRAALIPPLDAPAKATVVVSGDDWKREATVELGPVRPWKLFIVQHTHTDIGYTAYPSRINVDHLTFIDEAVRACRVTDDYPDDSRFRWTCEVTWAVERYVRLRPPADVREFLERVRQGRIDVTAMQLNMTDLATEECVIRSFLPVRRLRKLGVPIRSALQCDVNGYPWALPELLEEIGVMGIAGGINQTRSTLPFAVPTAIAWESPSGGSITAWRGEHYMFANFMGLRDSVKTALGKLPAYLSLIRKRGYPHDIALLQQSGYWTDNATACHRASDTVREWNELFATPRLRMATLTEWFEALAQEPPPPQTKKAWPDWWADGVGSAPLEAAVIREAQEQLLFATPFLALARASDPDLPDRRAETRKAYLLASLYDEHTFGAAESVDRPDTVNTKTQWKEKSSYSYQARWIAAELAEAARRIWAPAAVARGRAGIVVFNSLTWERDAPLVFDLPRGIVEEGTPFRIVDAETGAEVPYRVAKGYRNYRDVEMVARRVPPVGYRVYHIEPGRAPAPMGPPLRADGSRLGNGVVEVDVDTERCGIRSLRALPAGGNVVDGSRDFAFGQFVHERIVHEKGRWHLWPMVDYAPESFHRTGASGGELSTGVESPVRGSLRLATKVVSVEGPITVDTEISVWRGLRAVTIENRVKVPGTTEAVASYFAFPFAGGEPPRADVVGGVMVPGRDQIPGTAHDWHAIQRWVRFGGGNQGATWVTLDVPLVQFGGFNVGRWTKNLTLDEPVVYSWASNNYWFTNFVAKQEGEFVFRYVVAPGEAGASDEEAHRVGRGACSPLRALVVDGTGPASAPASRSLLSISPSAVDLVGVKEAEETPRAVVLHLRNRSGSTVGARVRFGPGLAPRGASRTDILEDERAPLSVEGGTFGLEIPPWRLRTVLVRF